MTVGFSGDVAGFYAKYRRGYPPEVYELLRTTFALTEDDLALDLGCGTGALTLPLAASGVRAVLGMDPEPDMLRLAREAAARAGARNVTWVLGSDADVPALGPLLDGAPLAVTVVGQALHWMRHEALFRALAGPTRPGGGVAVISNGRPLWLQDSDWSRALRGALEEHFGTRLRATCGTGAADRRRYARALEEAGFGEVRETVFPYAGELSFEEIVGGVCSAVPAAELPEPAQRPAFAERLRRAVGPGERFPERVEIAVLTGRIAGTGRTTRTARTAGAGATGAGAARGDGSVVDLSDDAS